jgi:hypothetical protein
MKGENWAKRKTNLRKGSGDRTRKEKQMGNDYFDCDYEDDD